MPFKLNQDRRHHIPRQQHKVTNWPAYEAGLRQRGSLTVWFTDEAVAAWAAAPRTTRGGQPFYSPLAILTALTLRAVFRLAYRQAEGLIGSIISLLGLTLRVPDHTTLSRRSSTLAVPRPQLNNVGDADNAQPLHLLVDSTGLKLCGAGEWLVEKHGTRTRRAWRKLHLGVDAGTGQIVAAALTGKEVDDAAQIGPLLDQVTGSLASVTADGAYDQDGVYADVAERHPDAAVIVPPRCTAVLSEQAATAPTQRDRHLQCIAERGRMGLAASVRLQQARQGRGGDRAMETGDRRRPAFTYRRTSGDRSQRGGRCPQPHAGARTPELCPHRLTPKGDGVVAYKPLIHAPRWRAWIQWRRLSGISISWPGCSRRVWLRISVTG